MEEREEEWRRAGMVRGMVVGSSESEGRKERGWVADMESDIITGRRGSHNGSLLGRLCVEQMRTAGKMSLHCTHGIRESFRLPARAVYV